MCPGPVQGELFSRSVELTFQKVFYFCQKCENAVGKFDYETVWLLEAVSCSVIASESVFVRSLFTHNLPASVKWVQIHAESI